MAMAPGVRKFALTAHIASSVGFLGAVVGFLALAVAGVASQHVQMVRAAYLAMELTAWFVIVPLAVASLLTGIVQALGTEWGLLRHWWVVVKFLISILATSVLLIYLTYRQTLGHLAGVAAETSSGADLEALRSPSPLLHGTVAVVLLLVATTLSVYKPRGLTTASMPSWVKVFGIVALLLALFVVLFLTGVGSGHGPGRHIAH
jgi:hypothetical protein